MIRDRGTLALRAAHPGVPARPLRPDRHERQARPDGRLRPEPHAGEPGARDGLRQHELLRHRRARAVPGGPARGDRRRAAPPSASRSRPTTRAAALNGQPADVLVLIDGSDSSLSGQALAAANGMTLSRSLTELAARAGVKDLAIRTHPLLLFNPDSRSANLLIPGLVAILLTFSGRCSPRSRSSASAERGTLEQLMVTPASPVAVVLGKLLPYLALAFVQLLFILFLMTVVFRVPIHGSLGLLLGLSIVYLFALLALGLLVSSRAKTQMEAIQIAQMFLLPSIMLSGYIFPLSSLPAPLRSSRRSSPRRTSSPSPAASSSAAPASATSGTTSRRCSSSPSSSSPAAHGRSTRRSRKGQWLGARWKGELGKAGTRPTAPPAPNLTPVTDPHSAPIPENPGSLRERRP